MKRVRKNPSARISKDAERLLQITSDAFDSGCRVEDRYWGQQLETLATELLNAGNDGAVEMALDVSFEKAPEAHDLLAESVEAVSETYYFNVLDQPHQALLVSVPMIVWSKYSIAAGHLKPADVAAIHQHLRDFIFAVESRSIVNPFLYSIDHLPQSFSETRKLLQHMANAIVGETTLAIKEIKVEAIDMPADTRMLLSVVVVPVDKPLFRWQESSASAQTAGKAASKAASKAVGKAPEKALLKTTLKAAAKSRTSLSSTLPKAVAANNIILNRTECLTLWAKHATPDLAKLVPGASLELGLPDAFFRSCRECDRRVRPYMVSSAVEHLEAALSTSASQLHAIIAGVGEAQVDEYRVAFALKDSGEVVNGMIWPLVAQEDDDANPGPCEQIEAILKASNVGKITKLPGVLPPEFCEDCGAPLFYDADAEAVHPHMPDDSNLTPAHYH